MSTTTTDIFLDEGDQFIAGTSNINGGDKHTVRLGGVTVYGSLAELTELRDSLSDAIHAHRAPRKQDEAAAVPPVEGNPK